MTAASLRRRLIWILLILTLLAWVTATLLTAVYASRVLLQQVDRQLNQYSDLVGFISEVFARQLDAGVGTTVPWIQHDVALGHHHDTPMIISGAFDEALAPALNVWLDDALLATMENSPRFERPVEQGFSFRVVEEDHSHWRLLTRYDAVNGLWLVVGIELDAARWALLGTLGQALLPLLVILPLTLALLYFGVARGLRPVRLLAEQISRRSPQALDPIAPQASPEELQPVVAALNKLLQRLADALLSEQRFTANAAHELRTPLAAIKTEVQLCQRQLAGSPEADLLQRIVLRVDRATHSVEQLLTLARLDPDAPGDDAEVDLAALLPEVLAETGHLAAARDLQVDFSSGESGLVSGDSESLAILLRNLLINAFHYANEASVVTVLLRARDSVVELVVCNDCKALSNDEFRRITERFYRVPGSTGTGAGLGLSIVSRIAEQHRATFTAGPGEDGEGFCARLLFPQAPGR
jgi:signal transduction histidine kinase